MAVMAKPQTIDSTLRRQYRYERLEVIMLTFVEVKHLQCHGPVKLHSPDYEFAADWRQPSAAAM
jgi:hypothetical protein